MKKSIVFSAVFIFGMFSVFAGPFGFSMGMTLDEITLACDGTEPKYIGDDRYYVQPAKSHPLFDGYVVWVSETSGLYYIKGISKEIKTTGYGTEVKQEFSKLLSPLERKYGKFKKTDKIEKDTLWNFEIGRAVFTLLPICQRTARFCEPRFGGIMRCRQFKTSPRCIRGEVLFRCACLILG